MIRKAAFLGTFALLIVALAFIAAPAGAASCYQMGMMGDYVCNARPAPAPFSDPDPMTGSFLNRAQYARLLDFADVYDRPNGQVVRNAGDGYLFVTIMSGDSVDGVLWYQINPGEWVPIDDLLMVDISEFRGVEVNMQPERPFGWVVLEVVPSDAPDGEPNPQHEKLERYDFVEIYDAQVGEDDWIWYDVGDGRWVKQIHFSLVEVTRRPEEVGPNEFWSQIDLYEQTFAAYEGDRMVFASLISSGLNRWPTHEGLFEVWDRHVATKMSGAEGKVDYYFIEEVPHTMFFDNDIALHGAYWHDRFGYKHSHGCVNMPPFAAQWVYDWSENAPNDLWMYVYTSDPHHYFERYVE